MFAPHDQPKKRKGRRQGTRRGRAGHEGRRRYAAGGGSLVAARFDQDPPGEGGEAGEHRAGLRRRDEGAEAGAAPPKEVTGRTDGEAEEGAQQDVLQAEGGNRYVPHVLERHEPAVSPDDGSP